MDDDVLDQAELAMTWFKLAGEGCFHAKVLAAKNDAYGAWCRAGQWSSEHLTEGRITRDVALAIAPVSVWNRLRDAKAGSEHGLVEEIEGGWQIHDYLDWNPTAEQALAKRAARAEAGRKGGEAKAARRQNGGTELPASQANDLASASQVAKQKPTPSPSPSPSPSPDQIPEILGDGASPGVSKIPGDEPPLLTIVEPAKPRKRKLKQDPKSKPEKTRARILEEAFALGCEDYTHVARPVPYMKQDGVALEAVADARCKGLDAQAEAAWIRAAAWRWTRARDVDEHKGQYFPGGVKVDGFAQWIGTETATAESLAERVRRSINASSDPAEAAPAPEQEKPREPRVVLPPGYRPTLVIPTSVTPVIDTTRFWLRKPVRQEQEQEAVNE